MPPSLVARRRPPLAALAVFAALIALGAPARADERPADPSNYRTVVGSLRPGDTMRLAPGTYGLLSISGLNGTADAPIVIAGPATGAPAVFNADPGPCCNTVEIRNSSFLVLRDVTIDGHGVDGAFGVSAGGGMGNLVHHITIEGCTFLHHDASQQTVAISTKTPTWGWVIRGNRIIGAGTGLYLGNSDGTSPFVGGLIEYNLVQDTVGYNMEIKFQTARPTIAGMPTDPTTTIIRHNVWIKTDRPSPDGDRPNVLVGGFPTTGAGSMDRYEIYGNVFLHNPRESLLQASGRVTIHDNVFADVAGRAMLLQNHDLPLRQAYVYDNTIYAAGTGIAFGSSAPQGDAVVGNLVFAATPITGPIATQHDNVTDTTANAGMYVTAPSTTPGMMDFYPLANGRARGAAVDLSPFAMDHDADRDFNCTPRAGALVRGAYAGEGTNPGWRITADIKPVGVGCGGNPGGGDAGAGGDGGGSNADASMAGGDGSAGMDASSDGGAGGRGGGCGCVTVGRDGRARGARGAGARGGGVFVALALGAGVAMMSRRRRTARQARGGRARRQGHSPCTGSPRRTKSRAAPGW